MDGVGLMNSLAEAAERFYALLEWAPDGIVISDSEGKVILVNQQAEHLFGYERGELVGHSVDVLLPEASRSTHGVHRARYNAAPRTRPMGSGLDLVARRKDGSTFPVEISLSPVQDDSIPLVTAVIRDISDRKRAELEREQLLAREQAARAELERHKNEFLANVSHDLRTPLTAIKASIGVVLANEPPGTPEPLHRMFVNIEVAADRMTRLVADLLELTRLQAGRVELRPVECDLGELARRSVRAIEPLLTARGQKLLLDLPPEPLFARVDPDRLEQALLNILENAQKYGPTGGTILLRLERHPDEALFAVTDEGPGVPLAEQQRIFERFFRSETDAVRRNEGSGLGLPIARAMVELHGGRIWVESTAGAGATFCIALPTRASSQVIDEGEGVQ